jgi:hypothetical protein
MKTEPEFAPARLDASSESPPGKVSEKAACTRVIQPTPGARQQTGQREIGGRKGSEPTRYGDWEKDGRCIDF